MLDEATRRGYRSILLVTSKYHTRRAAEIYRLLAGDRVKIIVRPARDDDFQSEGWWRDRISTRRVIIEYQKLAQLRARRPLGPVAGGALPAQTPARAG